MNKKQLAALRHELEKLEIELKASGAPMTIRARAIEAQLAVSWLLHQGARS